MKNLTTATSKPSLFVPITALTLYAVASGYLMSIIPLMLHDFGFEMASASWLASAFYAGLLVGALCIEPVVAKIGHKASFVLFMLLFTATIVVMPLLPTIEVWLSARVIAGMAVAGIFVVVESWLLIGDDKNRGKRLSLYMCAVYGGSSLGQLGIGFVGDSGMVPFVSIFTLLMVAVLLIIFGRSQVPETEEHVALTVKQLTKLNKAAVVGCVVSGLLLGAVYGLMPLELKARSINSAQVGSMMALLILGGMLIQPVVAKLSAQFSRITLMAMFSVLGVFAIGLIIVDNHLVTLAVGFVLFGMASFALYPISIALACTDLPESNIVSATQIMLLSYSIGSVSGPMLASKFMHSPEGLMGYLFVILLSTSLYMLAVSLKAKRGMVVGK